MALFFFLRLWGVVYGFSSDPGLPVSTSEKRGDFSEKEREIPWDGRASGCQLWTLGEINIL